MDFSQIKIEAKEALVGNRLMFLLAILVAGIVGGAVPGLNIILSPLLMAGLFVAGKVLLADKKVMFESLFEFFRNFDHAIKIVLVSLLTMIIVFVGLLLLIVPGIIFAYRYSQALFIISENKDMDVVDALKASRSMMQGKKMNLFLFQLSFIGHVLLGIITLGIYLLYALPYIQLSMYNYYLHLKADNPELIEAS